ncbi:endonuclease VIII [Erwinia sp. OLTSP20]|uniref:endonuclease VIII n=1 Tax=unclassified Erwinia TaxID=2622719 RepID=UPI000C187013|nr:MULTISPECIES: endonuclease VIII [unclassified Erwinia]PIJ48767.1 endonuclease VIII [Erwinia sp. OAMSP11]PIJ69391.1 endonuclease VIII [Erwinia sp. OLSSP12]PIJ79225.1 endonuclease VIII [Erwinia sp. OLCASP19]PIJ80751.1 endonuclease VIII [Erwinia sp. OLMTSP26]PIJ82902.1 endonuclease VIII [Erwinia sp. OLMDSP33]
MPEGPEIRRVADKIAHAVGHQPLTDVWFAMPALKTYEPALIGEQISAIETRGKAMLTHFSNGLTLYSHNQLYGLWHITGAAETTVSHRVLRVRLATAENQALLYSASDIALLDASGLAQHPFLQRAGPDVLDPTLDVSAVAARLLSARFCRRRFSSLLLDQAFLAGLGNYLRAEILWHAALLPTHRGIDLTSRQCETLSRALIAVPRLSYQTRGTMETDSQFRFEVFQRQGKKCRRCASIIEKTHLASRPFFWCPGCQK